MLALYLLVVGLRKSISLGLEGIKHELAEQKKYADEYALPEKQAKAYRSSIEFLENYSGLVEDSRDVQWSIGAILLPVVTLSFSGVLVAMRRGSRRGQHSIPLPRGSEERPQSSVGLRNEAGGSPDASKVV
jgi:hypothetical protein